MLMRDNAQDFAESGPSFRHAWYIFSAVETPPSIEVFEHWYVEENRSEPHLTPAAVAMRAVEKWTRGPTPMRSTCLHNKSEWKGVPVCAICDGIQLWPTVAD